MFETILTILFGTGEYVGAWVPLVSAGISLAGSLLGGRSQRKAQRRAAREQMQAQQAALAEQRAARAQAERIHQQTRTDIMGSGLSDYAQAGRDSLGELQGLAAGDPSAIRRIEQGPEYQRMVELQDEGVLQNAAATGGLRGGNVQRALAQVRPDALMSVIRDRINRLGTIYQGGLSAAGSLAGALSGAGQSFAGGQQRFSEGISGLHEDAGAIQAGRHLGQAASYRETLDNIGTSIGQGLRYFKNRGGGGAMPSYTSRTADLPPTQTSGIGGGMNYDPAAYYARNSW